MAFFKFMNYLDFNMSNSTHILCKKKETHMSESF